MFRWKMCCCYWLSKKTEFHPKQVFGWHYSFFLISKLINGTLDPTNQTKKIVIQPLQLFVVHCYQISIALTTADERRYQEQLLNIIRIGECSSVRWKNLYFYDDKISLRLSVGNLHPLLHFDISLWHMHVQDCLF